MEPPFHENTTETQERRHRSRLRRLLPVLFKRSRVVQIGDPLRHTEKVKRRRLAGHRCMIRCLWVTAGLLFLAGTLFAYYGQAFPAILAFECTFFPALFAWLASVQESYVLSRWLILPKGLLHRSSKDRHGLIPWEAIRELTTKYGRSWSQIAVRTDAGTELIQANNDALLPFLNKLVECLPHESERTPLLELRRRLRYETLRGVFFRNESNLSFLMLLCIPVILPLTYRFPPTTIGIPAWSFMVGAVFLATFGLYLAYRHHRKQRHDRFLKGLLDELETMTAETAAALARLAPAAFGPPPRVLTARAKRSLFLIGEGGGVRLCYYGLFGILALVFAGILFSTNANDIRYGFLPFRWEQAGEGRIVAIADSSTKKAPNGNPSPPGRDVITLEQTLPDGRIVRCQDPGWSPRGQFLQGQTVALLRYRGDPDCLTIDPSCSRKEMGEGVYLAAFLVFIVLPTIGGMVLTAVLNARHAARLMETANVERFRIAVDKKNRKKLMPLDDWPEPIPVPLLGDLLPGESVDVFIDTTKPEKSFIAQTAWSPLRDETATRKIDVDSGRPFLWAVVLLGMLFAGIVLALSRILWGY